MAASAHAIERSDGDLLVGTSKATALKLAELLASVRAEETAPLLVEIDREEDGRWVADVPALPGVMCYGQTQEQAVRATSALTLRVIADEARKLADELEEESNPHA